MLLPVLPLALVRLAIGPVVAAESVLLLHDVLALVAAAVSPGVDAFAMHFVRLPLALVDAAVSPAVLAFALDAVVDRGSDIDRVVRKIVPAVPVLFAQFEVAFIDAAVYEFLFADIRLEEWRLILHLNIFVLVFTLVVTAVIAH